MCNTDKGVLGIPQHEFFGDIEVNNVVGRYWRKSHGKRRYHVNSHEASSPTPIDKEIMVEAQEE